MQQKSARAILWLGLANQAQKVGALLLSIVPQPQTDAQAVESPVLVQSAISRRPSNLAFETMQVEVFADLVKVKRSAQQPAPPSSHNSHRVERGHIKNFSRRSRKRMIEQLAKLRDVSNGHFVTLTYPDDVVHSPDKAKRDLAALQKRLLRRWPTAGGIWRMELQPRKSGALLGELAPHFHILLFHVAARPALLRAWMQLVWSRIVYETDNPPRRVRTRVDAISSRKHAARYASKYAAKEETLQSSNLSLNVVTWGRRWAAFGDLDSSAAVVITITAEQAVELRRLGVRWLRARGVKRFEKVLARGSPHVGFSILGLGDKSQQTDQLFETTIMRMLVDGVDTFA